MPEIELLYWPEHGRGLLIRMLLKMGGVEFKDTKISPKEFAKIKSSKLSFLKLQRNWKTLIIFEKLKIFIKF